MFYLLWQAGQMSWHFEKVHSLACCRLQKLVEAPRQTPIRISDFI